MTDAPPDLITIPWPATYVSSTNGTGKGALDRLFKLDASVIEICGVWTDADQARIKAWLPEDIRPEAGA